MSELDEKITEIFRDFAWGTIDLNMAVVQVFTVFIEWMERTALLTNKEIGNIPIGKPCAAYSKGAPISAAWSGKSPLFKAITKAQLAKIVTELRKEMP